MSDIELHLEKQIRLLKKSCLEYDNGDHDEYGRIATAIRVIAYDQGQSRSLLGQLGMKGMQFNSYGSPVNPRNLLAESRLTMAQMTLSGGSILPILDATRLPPRQVPFDVWWDEDVIRLQDDTRMRRSDVVLIAANQDGGAHVDPELDEVFHRVAKLNEASFQFSINGGPLVPMADVEKAVVRHIAFEVIESVEAAVQRRAGNNGCACGSGKKNRYCCGKHNADGSTPDSISV